jgi:hypothetical protein
MVELLSDQASTLQFEFATLVSSNFTIQVGANNNRRGQIFNPSNVARRAIELEAPIAVSLEMDYSEFAQEGAPRFL